MIILGAKGLAKELISSLDWDSGARSISFFDNYTSKLELDQIEAEFELPVLRNIEELNNKFKRDSEFIVGVGGATSRIVLYKLAIDVGGTPYTYVSTKALVGINCKIGEGVCIMPFAMVTHSVNVGTATLINKCAILSHDSHVGAFCDIGPGVKILGNSKVEDNCDIGTNAVILPNIKVGFNSQIGAGSIVNKDIPPFSRFAGVPAKPL
jgi:sugar O-acyltransferase (sialic acid O-acetyltransferase NeuD family)